MSAEFNTEIQVKGTKEDLFNAIKTIFNFNSYSKKKKRKNHPYLEGIIVTIPNIKSLYLDGEKVDENEIRAFVDLAKKEIKISAEGPYGCFNELGDVNLFECIAEAAPKCYFKGSISGFSGSADQNLKSELKDSKLYIEKQYSDISNDDGEYGQYVKFIKKELPYSKFCKLFKIDKNEFDEECYNDFIIDTMDDGIGEIDYETFMDSCYSDIEEDEFDVAIKKISNLNLLTFVDFVDEGCVDEEKTKTTVVYDPIKKAYLENGFDDYDEDEE